MAKRVNNIAYKGINHSPSLVSDNDGHASECVNLSPDYNDLKPMPMPVKREDYQLEIGYSLLFLHQGIGYENYVEIDETHTRLVFKDAEGNYLYYAYNSPDFPYWSNESEAEILAIEAIGNTVIVSTKAGVEYIVFQPDVHIQGQTGGSYKPIGQRPPMPVIEFRLHEDEDFHRATINYGEDSILSIYRGNEVVSGATNPEMECFFEDAYEQQITDSAKGAVAKLNKEINGEGKFYMPFFVRYALRMRTSDYIMQSPLVLMLPSSDKCPIALEMIAGSDGHTANKYNITKFTAKAKASKLQYKINNALDFSDWSDIIEGVDVFVDVVMNYDDVGFNGNNDYVERIKYWNGDSDSYKNDMIRLDMSDFGLGNRFVDGLILEDIIEQQDVTYGVSDDVWYYKIKNLQETVLSYNIKKQSVFNKVSFLPIEELTPSSSYIDLGIDNLNNLATLPTLEDDYFTHNAVSPSLMQVYNSRLNMANISQKVFKGFVNGFQPQSINGHTHPHGSGLIPNYYVYRVYYKVKKNGKTYIVTPYNDLNKLDYTSYLYYPDPDCYEAVVLWATDTQVSYYYTLPMKRHEYLNGSYWYDDMKCLAQYLYDIGAPYSGVMPDATPDDKLWYKSPNRFMMSSVGNPWHFPIGNQFDIGRREIRALSLNAENMNAPQYGQNPIYVFSSDGIWTLSINADGTVGKPSYVSGDVVSEMAAIGNSPTAASEQVIFFKTNRGISAIVGSAVKEIDLVMKGRVFNPRTMLLPQGSIVDGVPTIGIGSYWLDLIYNSCDDLPYADFAKESNLLYDYRNNRLLLYHKDVAYMYVYDIRHDFWSKMLPIVVDESETSPAMQEYNTRSNVAICVKFNGTAMAGNNAILTDDDRYMWNVGGQPDENDISGHHFGLYVSRPLRFGTDDMKTLSRIVHDQQLGSTGEAVKMALYGSRNGKDYYQVKTLRGTAYKFYIIVLYTKMLASSRYAYTAFEWEARTTDKIR